MKSAARRASILYVFSLREGNFLIKLESQNYLGVLVSGFCADIIAPQVYEDRHREQNS